MPIQDETPLLPSLEPASDLEDPSHATCPPDDDRLGVAAQTSNRPRPATLVNASIVRVDATRHAHDRDSPTVAVAAATELPDTTPETRQRAQSAGGASTARPSAPSPATAERLAKRYDEFDLKAAATGTHTYPSPFPPARRSLTPPEAFRVDQHTSSFLRHGSKFVGTQQSDRQVYNVTVELKHVDMRESFLCGYLRIEGLTDQQRILTTYFEGEIIGTKYTFQTRHPDWGSNMKVDMQHWNRFPAWRPLARQAQSDTFNYRDYAQREHLFMRWKEHFLVPDHRVTHITGASFEGFYFICFNQIKGTISGIYFHSKSEKFQQLELNHVDDFGCTTAQEFA